MKYKELIELYKAGNLDDERKEQVEKDIEKQSAISDYLFDIESEEFNESENLTFNEDLGNSKKTDDFTKFISNSIRKTFIKTGVIVGVVVLAIVCFIVFAIPKIKDAKYYNPAEKVGTFTNGCETNRMSLDMAVYSEMFLPGMYRDAVLADGNGNAKYDICIIQSTSYSDSFYDVGGVINKGKMLLYDTNPLKSFAKNVFIADNDMISDVLYSNAHGAAGTKEEAYAELDKLNDTDSYVAYVTLNTVMDYTEFKEWAQKNDVHANWCKLCFTGETGKYTALDNIGFIPGTSCSNLYYDKAKYPFLTQFSLAEADTDKDMTTHVSSILNYLSDQDKFRELMQLNLSSSYLKSLAEDVEQNGIHIYGFTMISDKESICALRNLEEIGYIYTKNVKYE